MVNDNDTLEAQSDARAEQALLELGASALDAADEYEEQCGSAGCYPWLEDVICIHPHERALHGALFYVSDDSDLFTGC